MGVLPEPLSLGTNHRCLRAAGAFSRPLPLQLWGRGLEKGSGEPEEKTDQVLGVRPRGSECQGGTWLVGGSVGEFRLKVSL